MRQHKLCFDSVAVIIQIKLMLRKNKLFRPPDSVDKITYTMAQLKVANQRYTWRD